MNKTKINDIMVPVSDYATVHESADLLTALDALESEHKVHLEGLPYRHRAVLVLNDEGNVIGKASQIDIIRAIEPGYGKVGVVKGLSRFGFSKVFINSIYDNYSLWGKSKSEIRQVLVDTKITDVMYKPTDLQHVDFNDTLSTALHQIVMGQHQSLLVLDGDKIIGILRSTDVFNKLYSLIMA